MRKSARQTPDLRPLLAPRAVAILGASDDPARIGGRPLRYMLEAGFDRPIYPVNPKRTTVQGLKAYGAMAEVPGPVDCALIAVPAAAVVGALEDCASRGVRCAVIFSSGFAEAGPEGAALQARLRAVAAGGGIRVVGPNCLGLFNAEIGFYATFSSSLDGGLAEPGPLAILSQSGAYGTHVFAVARKRGLGVRYLITTGNESDLDVADCIAWAAEAEEVRVIVAYAEGIRDGAALIRGLELARRRGKPVVFMKVGRSSVGAAAAASHTAALAGTDAVYDGVFRQYGAHRAASTEELLDVAYACAPGLFPAGRRIGLVTISGGVGVQMADRASDLGLEVSPMPERAQEDLKRLLPYAAPRNPVDITAQAFNDLGLVAKNFSLMLEQGGYDAIVAFFTMVAASRYIVEDLVEALEALRRRFPDRLVVLSILGPPEVIARYEAAGFLVFEDPCRAVDATAALMGFGAGFARARKPDPPADPPEGLEIPARDLSEHEAREILAAAGLPLVTARLARDAGAAAAAAAALGPPVALKLCSPDLAHKTEVGGVLLDLASAEAARRGFATLTARLAEAAPGARFDGVLVSPMVRDGVEAILGMRHDPAFGPVVMCGLGGVFVEVLRDVAFRVAPFGPAEARRMIGELKGAALLHGVRGRPAADVDALAEALVRLSALAAAQAGRIESIDVNPFVVLPAGRGALALDALIVPRRGGGSG